MPVHDWSRVDAGLFHHFHQAWMGELARALNNGVLPEPFYAIIEQYAGKVEVDVLALRSNHTGTPRTTDEPQLPPGSSAGMVALIETSPEVDVIERATDASYAFKQSSVVVREVRHDRVVGLIEVVSHGNKSQEYVLERFIDKAANALMASIQVVVIDLQPPGKWDPHGLQPCGALGQPGYTPPPDKNLTLASYTGAPDLTAYVKPVAVGDALAPLPLFLVETHYVRLPLEETYQAAYSGVPRPWREVIEGRAALGRDLALPIDYRPVRAASTLGRQQPC